jgi:hypothetical protein
MLKALAIVRTLVLIFLVGYTVRAMPWFFGLPTGSAQAYDTCRNALSLMTRAAWISVAWVGFETIVGWLLASRRPKVSVPVPKGGEPPFAPPPHG